MPPFIIKNTIRGGLISEQPRSTCSFRPRRNGSFGSLRLSCGASSSAVTRGLPNPPHNPPPIDLESEPHNPPPNSLNPFPVLLINSENPADWNAAHEQNMACPPPNPPNPFQILLIVSHDPGDCEAAHEQNMEWYNNNPDDWNIADEQNMEWFLP